MLALFALGAFAFVTRDPKINFLPRDSRAEWIIFPRAIDTGTHPLVRLDTRFRRNFDLARIHGGASLFVRAATQCEIKLNDHRIIPHTDNWKRISSIDVGTMLRAGANTLEVTVFNKTGPPALWLCVDTWEKTIPTDESWEASFTGSTWRQAVSAASPRFPGPGNLAFGGEKSAEAVARIWPLWLFLAATGVLLIYGWKRWLARLLPPDAWPKVLLGLIALSWVALFWNNTLKVPFAIGFDAGPHADYIRYIQERGALPLPNEGFEMYQPPLYYAISAGLLSLFGLSTSDAAGVALLRGLSLSFAVAHLILIFLILRLRFAGRIGPQIVGVTLAGFVPMHLYLSHYITNETLCATLVAATIYLALRILQTDRPSLGSCALLGLMLGASLLAKATALLLIPLLLIVLIAKFVRSRLTIPGSLGRIGLFGASCLAVCSWHYVRIWRQAGRPLVGNWEPAGGFAWWQDPGYRTAGDYLRFGRALAEPFFSGLNSFWDGIYGTLWGDGLWGGVSDLPSRTPWNHDLVTGGYLLAVTATILVLAGIIRTLHRYLKEPAVHWFLLLGWPTLLFSAIAFMTLKVAALGQIRAVYGLAGLVGLSAFGALGWETLTRHRPKLTLLLGVLVFVWAGNSFASHWVRDSAALHIYRATKFRSLRQPAAAQTDAERAVQMAPQNARARIVLSQALHDAGRTAEALTEADRAVQLTPNDTMTHLQLSAVLAQRGEEDRAIEEARRSLELGPENAAAYGVLLPALLETGNYAAAVAETGNSLGVIGFTPEAHYIRGIALAQSGESPAAADQFIYALLLRPGWPAARSKLIEALISGIQAQGIPYSCAVTLFAESPTILNDIAWLRATSPLENVRDGTEAVRLAEQACRTKGASNNAILLTTMAAAYAEAGKFAEAAAAAEQASAVARQTGNPPVIDLSEKLLDLFRAGRPYRQP